MVEAGSRWGGGGGWSVGEGEEVGVGVRGSGWTCKGAAEMGQYIPDMISQKAVRIPYINFPNNTAKWCSGCLVLPVLSSPEATRSEKGRAVTAETQFSDMHVPTPLEAGS